MKDFIANHIKQSRGFGRRLFKSTALAAGVLILSGLTGCARHHTRHADLTPEEAVAKLDRGIQWFLWKVDATEEQRAKIKAVLDEVKPDVVRFQSERQALKVQFVKALESDQVNQEELNWLRTAGLNLTEQAFNRSFDAMLKAAEVLTPEQRKELVESWKGRL